MPTQFLGSGECSISEQTTMATIKLYSYARVFKSQSEYAKRMKFLSDSIFGEVRRPTSKQSMAVVKKMSRKPYEIRKEIVEYYPAHEQTTKLLAHLRAYGLYRDEHADFKEEMAKHRRLKGKAMKFGKNDPDGLYYKILDKELGPPKKKDNDDI